MTQEEFIAASGEEGQARLEHGWAVIPAELDGGECDYKGCDGWHWVLTCIMREFVEIGMRPKEVLKWLHD